ncbi:unnamed protein product [Schistosoma rodhaini]|uniref:Uncharacterized protein n=1 Tax=Schistosoma rodhaini TaxID=6188 RepID=A0AA85FFE1_9TREM|nr:unnamed protein product [Schistosoma rodhaini]
MQSNDMYVTDDLDHLPHTQQKMQVKTNNIAAASTTADINTHKGNNKIMKHTTECTNTITLDGEVLEEVEGLTDLDTIVDKLGGSGASVKARIGKVSTTFLQLKNTSNSKQPSPNTIVTVFDTNTRTVPLYHLITGLYS